METVMINGKPVVSIDINGVLVGPNGVKYKISKFQDDGDTVVLKAIDTEHTSIIRMPIEELKNYTTEDEQKVSEK